MSSTPSSFWKQHTWNSPCLRAWLFRWSIYVLEDYFVLLDPHSDEWGLSPFRNQHKGSKPIIHFLAIQVTDYLQMLWTFFNRNVTMFGVITLTWHLIWTQWYMSPFLQWKWFCGMAWPWLTHGGLPVNCVVKGQVHQPQPWWLDDHWALSPNIT